MRITDKLEQQKKELERRYLGDGCKTPLVADAKFGKAYEKYLKLEKKAQEATAMVNYLKEQGVTHLIHFTPIENLKSIAEYGIIPMEMQMKLGIHSIETDGYRADGIKHSNFSISFPNSAMVYTKIHNQRMNLAMLKVDVDILLEEYVVDSVFFTMHNATCCTKGKGIEALKQLFSEEMSYDGRTIRRHPNIPSNQTTDYQAEVLIEEVVPAKFITSIEVQPQNEKAAKAVWDAFPATELILSNELFGSRVDQFEWIKKKTPGFDILGFPGVGFPYAAGY